MDDIDAFLLNGDEGSGGSEAYFNMDSSSLGGNGSLPLVSDITTQMPAGSLNQTGSGGSPGGVLGSILSEIQALPKQAASAGTLVGTIKSDLNQAKVNYAAGQTAASTNNSLATWWLYASTTDKLIVGLTAATVLIMLMKD